MLPSKFILHIFFNAVVLSGIVGPCGWLLRNHGNRSSWSSTIPGIVPPVTDIWAELLPLTTSI